MFVSLFCFLSLCSIVHYARDCSCIYMLHVAVHMQFTCTYSHQRIQVHVIHCVCLNLFICASTGVSVVTGKVGVAIGGRGQTGRVFGDFHVKSLEEIRAEKRKRQGGNGEEKSAQLGTEKTGEFLFLSPCIYVFMNSISFPPSTITQSLPSLPLLPSLTALTLPPFPPLTLPPSFSPFSSHTFTLPPSLLSLPSSHTFILPPSLCPSLVLPLPSSLLPPQRALLHLWRP